MSEEKVKSCKKARNDLTMKPLDKLEGWLLLLVARDVVLQKKAANKKDTSKRKIPEKIA